MTEEKTKKTDCMVLIGYGVMFVLLLILAVSCWRKNEIIVGQSKTIENNERQIAYVQAENYQLKRNQQNLEWFYSELEAIDNYIVWEKKLMANYKGKLPEIDTASIDYVTERSKVISEAIKYKGVEK